MGGDSCSEGLGFESQHWMGIFTLVCCRNCIDVCIKIPKIKEAGNGPIKKLTKLQKVFCSKCFLVTLEQNFYCFDFLVQDLGI